MSVVAAHVLNPGTARGALLVLQEPLSFWGGFDPRTGIILDARHPQSGRSTKDCIVLMHETRGSGSAAGGLAEAVRLGMGPLGVILGKPDLNLAIGAFVAKLLYGRDCPVITVECDHYRDIALASGAAIARDGTITLF